MSRPLNRLLLASTSALGITALTLGLAAPAGATPATAPDGPESVSAALDELRDSPVFGMNALTAGDQLTLVSEQRAPAARMATTASNVTVEEVARTETSATFRFTLPAGEVTREDAVLQAYWADGAIRYSSLDYLTNPVGPDGIDHYVSYIEQSAIGLAMVDLLRENFSISGATAVTGGVNDHLVIPAGLNTFDITVSSARTESELHEEIDAITGDSHWNYSDAAWILESRLALPHSEVWTYGERVDVIPSYPTEAQYPNGANELTALVSHSPGGFSLSIQRQDANPFSGDRVLRINDSMALGASVSGIGGDAIYDLIMEWTPPPLRPTNLSTVVTGATAVGNDFYRPNPGVTEVSTTTTHDGPKTVEEVRAGFTTWVTETCDAEMSDPIPGVTQGEEGEPLTWQEYLDTLQDSQDDDPFTTAPPIYTEPKYIGSVVDNMADQTALFRYLIWGTAGNENGMFSGLVNWDTACGATDGPGDGEGPGDGDDGPGDVQTPASISVDVPSTGVAGEPISLSATVLDDAGSPVEGQQVTFTIDEQQAVPGTLRAAALNLDPAADGPTTLTATTDTNGVATVTYTPSASGTLHVSASTGGANPVSTEDISLVTVTPAPGGGDEDDDDDTAGGGNQSGSGSLGSLFGSLSS